MSATEGSDAPVPHMAAQVGHACEFPSILRVRVVGEPVLQTVELIMELDQVIVLESPEVQTVQIFAAAEQVAVP